MALSDMSGVATLYVPASKSLDCEATATLAQGSWQQRKNSPSVEIQAVRFDDFEGQHLLKLDLVKVDVEDHEASVLRGMQNVIRRDRPFIVCEILPRAHGNEKTREIIDSLGYTPYWITPSGYIRVSRFDFERSDSENFLLSPVRGEAEIVTNLETLWAERQAAIAASRIRPSPLTNAPKLCTAVADGPLTIQVWRLPSKRRWRCRSGPRAIFGKFFEEQGGRHGATLKASLVIAVLKGCASQDQMLGG